MTLKASKHGESDPSADPGQHRQLQQPTLAARIEEDFEYALVLNPDCWLKPDCIERLIQALTTVPGSGMAGGKLWRMDRHARLPIRCRTPL